MSTPTDSVAPPYPTDTSMPWPMPAWWKKIADWIAALSPSGADKYDSGPVPLTFVAGTAQYSPSARRVGKRVYLDGAVQQSGTVNIPNTTWTTVCTLPVGMRPPKYQLYPANITTAGIATGVRVQTNGNVEVWFGGTTGAYIPLTGVAFWVA